MSYPQQPGNWSDQSWPTPNQPYSDPGYGAQPGYGPSATPQSPGYGYGYAPPMAVQQTNGLAIASMVVSLASIVVCGLPAIIGAIMGHVARRQIRERNEAGDGMALTGIIVGWIVFVLSVLGILAYVVFFVWLVNNASDYQPSPYYS
jgi:Domain of unknown function (DUF4190)